MKHTPITASRHAAALCALLCASASAHALEPACSTYLDAAEKSAKQTTRHSITETGGMRLEVIVTGGKSYSRAGSKWQAMNTDLLSAERTLISQIRSGKYPLGSCRRLGTEVLEGKPVTVYAYTLKIGDMPSDETRAYIGGDGLVHAQSTADAKVRHRYTGVTAPKL